MSIILSEIRADGIESSEQTFEKSVIRVGRDASECDIAFPRERFPMVSRRHAELRFDDDKWFVVDLGASYGTYLDSRRVAGTERIRAGQTLQFGTDGPQLKIVWFEQLTDSVEPNAEADLTEPPVAATNAPSVSPGPPVREVTDQAHAPSTIDHSPQRARVDATLVFIHEPGRAAFALTMQPVTFGRDPGCDITFDRGAVMVSRNHARLRFVDGTFVLEDNGSFNGTFINDQRIAAPTPVHDKDVLRFGIGGPELQFARPVNSAWADAVLAGQRSIAATLQPEIFQAVDAIGSKTIVSRLDKFTAPSKQQGPVLPQLLMSLTFGRKSELTIGRNPDNDITLDGLLISGRHARLVRSDSGVLVEDLNSTNGVYVNGVRVSRQAISTDDTAQIGVFELRVDAAGNIGIFDTRSRTRVDAVDLVSDVKVRSGRQRVLDGISFSIQPNEFVGILGPSGAGKSSLIQAMNCVRPVSSGHVLINNRDLYRHFDSLKQAIGYVPQDDIIHPELTVFRTLYYVAKLRLSRDVSSAEIDRIIAEVLDVTGIADRRDVQVKLLSGGERKRVSIAVELMTKPSVLFLDEPTSGLDPATEERVMKLFKQIAESGRTVILTTHTMENVGLFDKIVVLMRGKLVFYGKPQEALAHLGAGSYKQLFDKLEIDRDGESVGTSTQDAAAENWKQKFNQSPQYQQNVVEPLKELGKLPESGRRKRHRLGLVGSFRQWITLSRRYLELLLQDRLNLLILFAQAPLIAVLTYFVVGAEKPRDFAYFVLAMVSIWFGTSVAAREIIRERPVYRRERMFNLAIFPYLSSKLVVLALIVGIQCLLLFIPLKLLDAAHIMPLPGEMFGLPQFWAMLLSAGVGIAIGLFVSALVKSSEMATSLVPLILIPQMLFAGIVGVPTGISRPLSMVVPAAWSFDTIKRFSTLDTLEQEGADPKGRSGGLGLYKQIENDNDKLIADTRKNLEDYQRAVESARSGGLESVATKPEELPAVRPANKVPHDLSGYITFLHPWMDEVLNQIVLMLMLGLFVLASLVVLRLQDVR